MHSSIFNSSHPGIETRGRRQSPGRTWLMTVLLTVICLAAWESFWRSEGFPPFLPASDEAQWALNLRSVRADTPVILGTSRSQAAIDPQVWAAVSSDPPPVHLTLWGTAMLPILERLADKEDYRGLVIAGVTPSAEFSSNDEEDPYESYEQALRELTGSPAKRFELIFRNKLSFLVYRRSELSSRRLLERVPMAIRDGSLRDLVPPQAYWNRRPDRFLSLDFERVDVQARKSSIGDNIRETDPLSVTALETIIGRFKVAVDKIERRGGNVVFVHLPHTQEIRALEDVLFPRHRYWDRLAAQFPGTAIHFDDYQSLRAFSCPDGSHLDVRDGPEFTRRLAQLVDTLLVRS